ncbi:thioredoxin family protein [Caloranaerobacter ferrireducens]|uniref:thioredoxin family protein n=1 Tax=Caloranaerobacter ferrireducens TaxID=1323370 RepID=UPI00084DFEE5|nr:thioredoxin family protein [Caloranaerobacter ferrireducens]
MSKLAPIVDAVLKELNIDCKIEIISNLTQIVMLGVTQLPAIMINGEIKLEGRYPSYTEVKELLEAYK